MSPDREQLAARLHRSERANALAKVGAWAITVRDRRPEWSDEVARMHDCAPGHQPSLDEALGYMASYDRARVSRAVQRCLEEGRSFDLEAEAQSATGRRFWFRAIGEAVRGPDGEVLRIEGAMQDVTEAHGIEAERRALMGWIAEILEQTTDAVLFLDPNWRFTFVNQESERLLERPRTDLIGRLIWEVFPEARGSVYQVQYEAAVRNGSIARFEAPHGGDGRWFDVTAYPTSRGLAVYFRDVTERRAHARMLAEQAALLDIAHDAILVRDLAGRVRYWNQGATATFGWSAAEALGRDAKAMLGHDPAEYEQATTAALATGEWHGTLHKRHRDGRRLTVDCRWTLVRDEQGAPEAILAINGDVTAQRQLEQQFLRAQRLESIGALTGGIAHDLNNVLAPILLSLHLLREQTGAEGQEVLDGLQSAAQRGADLIRRMLSFARGLEERREPVALPALVHEVGGLLQEAMPRSITIVQDLPDTPVVVEADPTQLHQVLMNLCVNARDAMPDGGELRVQVRPSAPIAADVAASLGLPAGEYVTVRVSDTGTGIPTSILPRLFEPFFTTKPHGAGTGLGLPTTQSIVRGHGGSITVDSVVGVGSTFTVHLPALVRSTTPSAIAVADAVPMGREERILVVDDEPLLRRLAERILVKHGYVARTAADGHEALALLRAAPQGIDAALCDVAMPGMDGPETVAALRELRPDLPVVIASGYVDDATMATLLAMRVEHFVAKPYSVEALLTVLRGALERR
jgi:two-component system cell cycle sensor histidine kinase/response regulator CckA